VSVGEISMSADINSLPIILTLRTQEKNGWPIYWILGSSIVLILMFSLLLFLILGRWLRGLGGRLDALGQAVIKFQLDPAKTVSPEVRELTRNVETGVIDQVSLLAQELGFLMESASMRDEEQRAYLQTLDLLQDAVIEFTPQGKLLRATEAWNMLTGLDDIQSCEIENCVHPDDVAEVHEQIAALILNQKQQVSFRFRIVRQGEAQLHYWVEGRFASIKSNEQITSIRGVVRDITNTYRQERQISHMALHDALTNLPNRVLLEDRMGTAISRAARSGKRVALGFIDLDHFKQVNDNFGHKVGDLLLKQVTERLSSAIRSSDTLSRWGGDEFVILCPDLSSLSDARDLTNKLSALTSQNIIIEGTEFPLLFSAGFAVYPDDAGNSEMLMAQADRAMFYAKAQGRNNIQFFNAISGKESGRQSFYIQSRLSNAISNNEIKAWLQPLVSASSCKVIGAEVLARWHEQDQGWIPPDVFIPMAESLGMIDRLGQSVWQQALHAITLLPEDHRLSVNLSKRQLFSETIVEQFKKDVSHANISPGRIMLEITESIALSDVNLSRERIQELSQQGFGIAVDDFGVGYSSLSQLHEIPANELKLDMSFVRRIHEKSGHSMLSAIVSIAKSLNMETVAEGVEDAATAEKLREMGVDVLQGYYFAKPMPIDEYIGWLKARKN
jgi:diguanylate cyclase (GGDEF)-like protein/PAS domain S-box-containing protein